MRLDNRRYDTAAIRRDYPVEDLVARYGIALRRVGKALLGLCPFHADHNNPNFYVYPEKTYWKCRACGETGDVIQFVMAMDHVSFTVACDKILGFPSRPVPTEVKPKPAAEPRRWDHLSLEEQTLMNKAAAIYHDCLTHNQRALTYLQGRGIPDWVLRDCRVGYADGRALLDCLLSDEERQLARTLGLIRVRPNDPAGRAYESFAGRVVVPERRAGHDIWFIGRQLDSGDGRDRLKYLALPGERPVLGLERAAGRREVVLCEGVFDFLTAVAWRLPAFSTCGTQLPADRLGFLAKVETVFGAFDGDQAGQDAAARFVQSLGARFRPLQLPSGRDLNDLAQQRGGKRLFFELLNAQRFAARRPSDAA